MSDYQALTINPQNDTVETAMFLDNYYGHHCYGVRFSDGRTYPIDRVICVSSDNILRIDPHKEGVSYGNE